MLAATKDTFGESGNPAQLIDKYGLNAAAVLAAAKKSDCQKIVFSST